MSDEAFFVDEELQCCQTDLFNQVYFYFNHVKLFTKQKLIIVEIETGYVFIYFSNNIRRKKKDV